MKNRTITNLSAIVALSPINKNIQRNLDLDLGIQLERIKLMIRRMIPLFLVQLNLQTIRYRVRILHPPEQLAIDTATLIGNELVAYNSIRETHSLLPSHQRIGTVFDEYLDPNIEILFLIPHPEVSCSTLIRHISDDQFLSESSEPDLHPGQARIWYPKCRGSEYFTWNGKLLT